MEKERIKTMEKDLNNLRQSLDELTNEFYKFKMKFVLEDILFFALLIKEQHH